MQKSDNTIKAQSAHRRVAASTTLNRRYVKRPVKNSDITVKVSKASATSKIQKFNYSMEAQPAAKTQPQIEKVEKHPVQTTARARMKIRTAQMAPATAAKVSAKELKERAIKKALAEANKAPSMAEQVKKTTEKSGKIKFGASRVILALTCAATAVLAIAYFVSLNVPDISLRVAAMQTGIDASYPSYVPRDYKLSGVTSENAKIVLEFKNSNTGNTFSIAEEKSSWDSNALLNNYVKPTYNENYTSIREQGLTIYISGSNAAWVNGGTIFKITADSNVLTTKQIRSIAVSL